MVRIHPLIREILKGDNNVAVTVGKLDMKTNKHPFQGTLNNKKNVFADKNEAALMKKCEVSRKRCEDMHHKE